MVWWSGWVSVGLEAQYAWLPQMGLEPSSSPAQMGLEHAWLILKDTRPPNLPIVAGTYLTGESSFQSMITILYEAHVEVLPTRCSE